MCADTERRGRLTGALLPRHKSRAPVSKERSAPVLQRFVELCLDAIYLIFWIVIALLILAALWPIIVE